MEDSHHNPRQALKTQNKNTIRKQAKDTETLPLQGWAGGNKHITILEGDAPDSPRERSLHSCQSEGNTQQSAVRTQRDRITLC